MSLFKKIGDKPVTDKVRKLIVIPHEFAQIDDICLKCRNIAAVSLAALRDYNEELSLEYIIAQEPNEVEEHLIKHYIKELSEHEDLQKC